MHSNHNRVRQNGNEEKERVGEKITIQKCFSPQFVAESSRREETIFFLRRCWINRFGKTKRLRGHFFLLPSSAQSLSPCAVFSAAVKNAEDNVINCHFWQKTVLKFQGSAFNGKR
jgi:hypothetical protein